MPTKHIGLTLTSLIVASTALLADSISFQQGVNGYSSTQDTWIDEGSSTTNRGALDWIQIKTAVGDTEQALVRFDDIFGAGANQIGLGSTINSATLTVYRDNFGGFTTSINVSELLFTWDQSSATYANTAGGDGIQRNDVEASSTLLGGPYTNSSTTPFFEVDVTNTIAGISAGGGNFGWLITNDSSGTSYTESSEGYLSGTTPLLLTIDYTAVPEPSTYALLSGCLALAWVMVRRRS